MRAKYLILPTLAMATGGALAAAERPNIVFILADDLGYGDLSCLDSNSKIRTESLDAFASQSVIYTDAHSNSSVSTPTRYGILTGRYDWRSSLKQHVLTGYDSSIIDADRSTMATMLGKSGYHTALIGKWHLGWDWAVKDASKKSLGVDKESGFDNVDYSKPIENGPLSRGFDYMFAISGSLNMTPFVYVENNMPTAIPTKSTFSNHPYGKWQRGSVSDDFVHEEAMPNFVARAGDYIKEQAARKTPFFLYLPLPAPHTPILPTEDFRGKSGMGDYADYVLMMDAMVGRVLEAIDQAGVAENTIVVFTSDNGCSPAANMGNLASFGHYPNSIYRGTKADLYDGGHRVPCIVRWPAKAKPHEVVQTICLTDFYATFANIVGHEMADNEGEDSYNILPTLTSKREVATIREATIHHSIWGEFAVRKGEWKLLLSSSSGGWSKPTPREAKGMAELPPLQLYNMAQDPSEEHNLYKERPEIVEELHAILMDYIERGRSTAGTPQQNEGYPWRHLDYFSADNFVKLMSL
ncbi:MAG: arylsulfatase [Rikenellaceae bacterium]